MTPLPDLNRLSHAEKDALIVALARQVEVLTARVTELQVRLDEPPKGPGNSSIPPSQSPKANRPEKSKAAGRRRGSLGRKGGGRPLASDPDQLVIAKASACARCHGKLGDGDQVLTARYDKIDLPPIRPIVTRVERYAGHCPCCGGVTLAPVPDGMEEGSPFSIGIVALALYLRMTHAISYKRLVRLFLDLFGLALSQGALDNMFRRAKPRFDDAVVAILARLRLSRMVCSDETSVRIDGRTAWNWVFQNDQVVIHVIRKSRAAAVVSEVMAGHRPVIWVSDLYGAQQNHADLWQVCLAHQLRDCQYAIEAGDALFAPRMKALLLRAVVLARRRANLAESTRREYKRRLERALDAVIALQPANRHGRRLRKRYAKVRDHLFIFLDHPEVPPDNNGSERELRPTATYRKVTGGFRSDWGADLFASVRSVIGTAARRGIDAYQAIRSALAAQPLPAPG
jgi:transposase